MTWSIWCGRVRAQWPDVVIELRGDSGMAVPAMYEVCERLGIEYTFGLRLNPVLKRRSDALLAEAVTRYEQTGQPQRLFTAFWYQAESWRRPRWVVVKAEAQAAGHQSAGGGHQSSRRMRVATGRLRRVCRAG